MAVTRDYSLAETKSEILWVYEKGEIVWHRVTYIQGLYWMFDDALVLVASNTSVKELKVNIQEDECSINIHSNGFVSNNNKEEVFARFCRELKISKANGNQGMEKVFSNNPTERTFDCTKNEKWMEITLKPKLTMYNITKLDIDIVALMKRRVIDMVGCLGTTVKLELNGKKFQEQSFSDYVDRYIQPRSSQHIPSIIRKINDSLEICVTVSDRQFQHVTFVNLFNTIKGGPLVDFVANKMAEHLVNIINEKHNSNLTPDDVKEHLWIFLKANLSNASFDYRKETFSSPCTRSFTEFFTLPEDFLKEVAESQIVDVLKTRTGIYKEMLQIQGLHDAYLAGRKDSANCTLILTEGKSARALAMTGLTILGRQRYGVFPLKGKLLNVRQATKAQLMNNKEVNNIIRILGLQKHKKYEGVESLRYGRVMIMADQDHDGSHIKGLLINFFHFYWPSLLKIDHHFLVEFITPILKATKKDGNQDHHPLAFYSIREFEDWKEKTDNVGDYSIKYYKGLASFNFEEVKEYFRNIEDHKKYYLWDDNAEDAITLAFDENRVKERRDWLAQYKDSQPSNPNPQETFKTYSDFFQKEYREFCMAYLRRSIPSMVDGLKPIQRKILFCAFKKKLYDEWEKVSRFLGYVSEHSSYHHSERNIANVIVGMAQNHVGSNNVNLFTPDGNFGTRDEGGKDHANGHYLFTRLSTITRFIFRKEDEVSLTYLNEDGKNVEPEKYFPILPMVLVNGCEGIGIGWTTHVPNYNPTEIIHNLIRLMQDEPVLPMKPWYKGFRGTIEPIASDVGSTESYTSCGCIERVGETTTLRITELPICMSIQNYLHFLDSISERNANAKNPVIKDYEQSGDLNTIDILVYLSEDQLKKATEKGLTKQFNLETRIKVSNMFLFVENGQLKKYDTAEELVRDFYKARETQCEKILKIQKQKAAERISILQNKLKYAEEALTLQSADAEFEHLASMEHDERGTKETVKSLKADLEAANKEFEKLRETTGKSIWLTCLQDLEKELRLCGYPQLPLPVPPDSLPVPG